MPRPNEIKYLTAIKQEKRPKKFSRFEKYGISTSITKTWSS
jgi:small subunit ribosomal protein S18